MAELKAYLRLILLLRLVSWISAASVADREESGGGVDGPLGGVKGSVPGIVDDSCIDLVYVQLKQ